MKTRGLQAACRKLKAFGTGVLLALPAAIWGGSVVTDCTEANLRAAINGGGIVTFACNGTITLSHTTTNAVDTVLDATDHQVTISGSNTVRVFFVNSGASLTIINLRIANGFNDNGAAI